MEFSYVNKRNLVFFEKNIYASDRLIRRYIPNLDVRETLLPHFLNPQFSIPNPLLPPPPPPTQPPPSASTTPPAPTGDCPPHHHHPATAPSPYMISLSCSPSRALSFSPSSAAPLPSKVSLTLFLSFFHSLPLYLTLSLCLSPYLSLPHSLHLLLSHSQPLFALPSRHLLPPPPPHLHYCKFAPLLAW